MEKPRYRFKIPSAGRPERFLLSIMLSTATIEGRIQYARSIKDRQNELLKRILEEKEDARNDKLMKITRVYLIKLGMGVREYQRIGKEEIKKKARTMDTNRWEEDMRRKSSLEVYRHWKKEIKEEKQYDNRPASITLFKARANCLPLKDRKRHQNENTTCEACGEEEENLGHFILRCKEYEEERKTMIELQRPYEEDENQVIGKFLFKEERIEDKKELLQKMWKKREIKIRGLRN